jgi:hypothetical protein
MAVGERETVMAALFALGAAITWTDPVLGTTLTWATTSRKLQTFANVPIQPAFFQAEGDELLAQATNTPGKQTLSATWVIMHKYGADPGQTPTQQNNQIMDAIVAALTPSGADLTAYRQTLGGLAYHVWLTGKVFKDPGDMDGQGLILAPISILLPT